MTAELIALLMWLTGHPEPNPNPPVDPEVTLQGGGVPIQVPDRN